MGIPPKRLVLSKLIRRYFKRQSGIAASQEASQMMSQLGQCWEQYGVDHPKCNHLVPVADRGWALELVAQMKYQKQAKEYPSQFNAMLTPKIDKMYYKGRKSTGHN